MTKARLGWGAALLIVLASVVVPAVPARADTTVAVIPNMGGTVVEGSTGIATTLFIANASNGLELLGTVTIDSLTVVLSCGTFGGPSCDKPDPGVFRLDGITPGPGTACDGKTFTATPLDATGRMRLDPSSPIVLALPGTLGLDTCRLHFS